MSNITLPKIPSLGEPRKEEPLVCWGDIHRARAPAPLKEITEPKKPKRDFNLYGEVNWTPEIVAAMNKLINYGNSRSKTAAKLNELFPQKAGAKFTANTIAGKLARQKAKNQI